MGRTEPKFLVSENMMMWAFRYALGRMTGAVDDVCMHLKNNWKDLEPFTQNQIQDEIRTAIERGQAGHQCDVENWEEILKLQVNKIEDE